MARARRQRSDNKPEIYDGERFDGAGRPDEEGRFNADGRYVGPPGDTRSQADKDAAFERLSDNPFMGILGPNGEIPFPESWDEDAKLAYMQRLRDAARIHEQKEKESGIKFQGETVVVRYDPNYKPPPGHRF